MTNFYDTNEIHEDMKETLRERTPTELRNLSQRERVESDIDGTIRKLKAKFKVGTNAHAVVDMKNKSIKSITHDHETNTKDLDITEDREEENKEEINTMERTAQLMKQQIKHHKANKVNL